MKTALVETANLFCSLLPPKLRKWMFNCLLGSTARREPSLALRDLFDYENQLIWSINEAALRYEGGIHPKHRLMNYHSFFTKRLKPGERVLDIGCGYGAVAFSLAKAGMIVTGIDLDEKSILKARSRFQHSNLTFMSGDVTEVLPRGAYDVIVMSNVLEHLENRISFVKSVQARINPRRWLIRVPMINRHWTVYMKRELGLQYYSDPTHFTEYTVESFSDEMRDAGLAVNHIEIAWGEIFAELCCAPAE